MRTYRAKGGGDESLYDICATLGIALPVVQMS